MRMLPRVNEQVNEEWISDKTRFIWDGLRTQRLDRPYVRKDGRLRAGELGRSLRRASSRRSPGRSGSKIGAIAGDLATVEEMYALKPTAEVARLGEPRLLARTARRSIRRLDARATSSTRASRASKRPMRC